MEKKKISFDPKTNKSERFATVALKKKNRNIKINRIIK